jgi:hypothetical protein
VHWWKEGGAHARTSMVINAAGAVSTAIALVIVAVSKFIEGAWIVILLIPALMGIFLSVRSHYRAVGRDVATSAPLDATNIEPPVVLLPIRGWSGITRKALRFALKISPDIYALHVAEDGDVMAELEDTWIQRVQEPATAAGFPPPKLMIIFSPFRQLYAPLKQAVADLQRKHPGRDLAVIVPELVPTRWYHFFLHNQAASVIKAYLLFSGFRRVVVVNVPWYLSE